MGQGTTFNIYLPKHLAKETHHKEIHDKTLSQGHETVLLVEDEPAMLEMSRQMLQALGYKVLTAISPLEAISLAEKHSGDIDVLMTDVTMPEMNGRDLARRILSLYPDIRRLYMSGYTADIIARQGIIEEGVNFIRKPFSMEDVAAKLREVLS